MADPAGAAPTLSERSLRAFLDLLASAEPTPGGGAAAALAVAMAAGLVAMAGRLSAGRLAAAEVIVQRAEALRSSAADLAQADAVAYRGVLEAYATPDEPDPDARRERIRSSLARASDVPLAVAEAGAEIAALAAEVVAAGNPNLAGDALTAAVLAEAGVRASVALAAVNVRAGGLGDDRVRRGEALVDAAAADCRRARAALTP